MVAGLERHTRDDPLGASRSRFQPLPAVIRPGILRIARQAFRLIVFSRNIFDDQLNPQARQPVNGFIQRNICGYQHWMEECQAQDQVRPSPALQVGALLIPPLSVR